MSEIKLNPFEALVAEVCQEAEDLQQDGNEQAAIDSWSFAERLEKAIAAWNKRQEPSDRERLADAVSEILKSALRCERGSPYRYDEEAGRFFTRWGLVEKDIRDAILNESEVAKKQLTVRPYDAAKIESAREQGRDGPPWPVWIGDPPKASDRERLAMERARNAIGTALLNAGAPMTYGTETSLRRVVDEIEDILKESEGE